MLSHFCQRAEQELSQSNRSGVSLAMDHFSPLDHRLSSPAPPSRLAQQTPHQDPSFYRESTIPDPSNNRCKRKLWDRQPQRSKKRLRQQEVLNPSPFNSCASPWGQLEPSSDAVTGQSQDDELLDRMVAALILAQKDQQQQAHPQRQEEQWQAVTPVTTDGGRVMEALKRELAAERQRASIMARRIHQSHADLAMTYQALTRAMTEVDMLRQDAELQLLAAPINAHTCADAQSCCDEGSGDNFDEEEKPAGAPREQESGTSECPQNKTQDSMPDCRSCNARESTVLLMPCRHLALCAECSKLTGDCPVCRRHILSTINVNVE